MSWSADAWVAKGDPLAAPTVENIVGIDGNEYANKIIDESIQMFRQWLIRGVVEDVATHDWKLTVEGDDDGTVTLTILKTD